MDVKHCDTPVWATHSTFFPSKLTESVVMMTVVVWLWLFEAVQRIACITASISIVKLDIETYRQRLLSSWIMVELCLTVKPCPYWLHGTWKTRASCRVFRGGACPCVRLLLFPGLSLQLWGYCPLLRVRLLLATVINLYVGRSNRPLKSACTNLNGRKCLLHIHVFSVAYM